MFGELLMGFRIGINQKVALLRMQGCDYWFCIVATDNLGEFERFLVKTRLMDEKSLLAAVLDFYFWFGGKKARTISTFFE